MKKIFVVIILSLILNVSKVYALDTAKSTIVMDTNSGRILYEKNKDDKRLIASITKIMTAVIAIENKNLNSIVTIGDEVLPMYGSNIYITPNEKMTLKDLLYGLILRSGNDAAVAIATYVSGTEEKFVKLMNKKAQELGMTNTIFNNCTGLDDDTQNYSTAYDMALLSSYANTLMEYCEIAGTKKWTVQENDKTYIWYNRNKLLNEYKYAYGGKTGYTPKAGKTFVSTAEKDNLKLTIVSLNDSDMYKNHEDLYDYYFSKYKNVLLIDKDEININNNGYNGTLYVEEDFYYPLTEKEQEKIKIDLEIYKLKEYKNNSKVGEIIVKLDNDEIYKENILIRKNETKKESLFTKILKYIKKIF